MKPRRGFFVLAALAVTFTAVYHGSGVAAAAGQKQDELSVAVFASKLAIKADAATLATWQSEVEESLKTFQEELKKGYPIPATRQSLYPGSIFALREAPGKEFKYVRNVAPHIFDFTSTDDGTKRMVQEEVFSSTASVLKDPLRDSAAMAKHAETLMENLRNRGSKLRADVDMMASRSDRTLEMLKKGVAAQDLKELAAFEAKASEELAAAKKIVEDLYSADATAVKQTAEAGRLLSESNKMIAPIGTEANPVRKELRRLEMQFSHQVSSSGVEMQSSVEYMKRAEEGFALLSKAYQEGMKEVLQKKALLEHAQASEETAARFEEAMKNIRHSRSSASKLSKAAKIAQDEEDALTLQTLLTRLNDEKEKMRQAMDTARTMVADMSLRRQALDTSIADMTNESLKQLAETQSQHLSQQSVAMLEKLRLKGETAEAALSATSREITGALTLLLDGYSKAVKDSEAWLKQSAAQQGKLLSALKTKVEEADAVQKACDQFQEGLIEDIAAAQAEVASGESGWNQIEAKYSLASRGEAGMQLLQQAEAARQAAANAAAIAQKNAESFSLQAEKLLPTLQSSEKLARDLAESAKAQQQWLLNQNTQGKDAVVTAAEAANAGRRAEAATDLATSSLALSQAVKNRVEQLKPSVDWINTTVMPKLAPKKSASQDPVQTKKEADNLQLYIHRANDHVSASQKHLEGARQAKKDLDRIKGTLNEDVDDLKKALSVNPLDALGKQQLPAEPSDGEAVTQPGGAAGDGTPGGSEIGRLGKLATTVERRVGHLLVLATEMKSQGDLAEKAQNSALQDVANMRLSRLRTAVSEGGGLTPGEDGQDPFVEAEKVPRKVTKEVQQEADQLKAFRETDGGIDALREVADGVLQQLSDVLELAETRLKEMMATGVPELEVRMASVQAAAERLHPERAAADAAGTPHDTNSAAAIEFQTFEKQARDMANALHNVTNDVESCAFHVRDALKDLRSFRSQQSLSPIETDDDSTEGILPLSAIGPSVLIRRLSAATQPPAINDLLQQAGDLATRAGDARKGVLDRLAHLDALANMGSQPPPALPPATYTPAQPRTTPPGDSDGTPSSPDSTPGKTPKDESKESGSNAKLYLAVGVTGGILLLVGLSCCGLYAHRKRARRLSSLKQAASTTVRHQSTTEGEVHGEPPFFSPTLDFDEAPDGPGKSQSLDLSGLVRGVDGELGGELGGVTVVQTAEVDMGDLEVGKVETTKRQYFIDEHHSVAHELGTIQEPRCRTPLAYVFSSTQTDMRSPREGVPPTGYPSPRMRDFDRRARELSFSSTVVRMPQSQRESPSRRAREFENLEAEVERELQTQRRRTSSSKR